MTAPNDAFIDFIGVCYGKVPSLLLRTTAVIDDPHIGRYKTTPEKVLHTRFHTLSVVFAISPLQK